MGDLNLPPTLFHPRLSRDPPHPLYVTSHNPHTASGHIATTGIVNNNNTAFVYQVSGIRPCSGLIIEQRPYLRATCRCGTTRQISRRSINTSLTPSSDSTPPTAVRGPTEHHLVASCDFDHIHFPRHQPRRVHLYLYTLHARSVTHHTRKILSR